MSPGNSEHEDGPQDVDAGEVRAEIFLHPTLLEDWQKSDTGGKGGDWFSITPPWHHYSLGGGGGVGGGWGFRGEGHQWNFGVMGEGQGF